MQSNENEVVDLTLPSAMDFLPLVNGVTEEIADRIAMDEAERDALTTSVVEACTNAIEHGNKEDPRKHVRLRFVLSPARIEVSVTDEGKGFDLKRLRNPVKPENLLRERGRGIFIIKSFMDEVNFRFGRSGGTTIHLVKNIDRSAQAAQ